MLNHTAQMPFDDAPVETIDDTPVASQDDQSSTQPNQSRELDQFYTHPDVAAACMEHVYKAIGRDFGTWLEPSAGTGAFLDLLPTPRIGLDLDERQIHPEIKGGVNFLQWLKWTNLDTPIVTVGNPPFGRNASLALKFMNHAMRFSSHVCMILPRTFEKEAMQAKVDKRFELFETHQIASFSFLHDGKPYDVPCCFQIWSRLPDGVHRTEGDRFLTHSDFLFVEDHGVADFAFQRVGAKAGHVSKEGLKKSWKSHYFIQANRDRNVDPEKVRSILVSIDWTEVRARTAGNPSIGKAELVKAYGVIAGQCPENKPKPKSAQISLGI
jgi:predicted RNA methylase